MNLFKEVPIANLQQNAERVNSYLKTSFLHMNAMLFINIQHKSLVKITVKQFLIRFSNSTQS
jgi:hypothetical protein